MQISGVIVGVEKGNVEWALMQNKVCAIRVYYNGFDFYKILLKDKMAYDFWNFKKEARNRILTFSGDVIFKELRANEVILTCNSISSLSFV